MWKEMVNVGYQKGVGYFFIKGHKLFVDKPTKYVFIDRIPLDEVYERYGENIKNFIQKG